MVLTNRKVVKISKRKLGLVFVGMMIGLAVWYYAASFARNNGVRTDGPNITIGTMESSGGGGITNIGKSVDAVMIPDKPSYNQQIGIGDTREFLKTNYSATIKTRDVKDVVNSAKNIVKGNDGRVDNLTSSEKYGYLTFVVPKSKYEAFKTEIEALTHKKLFAETNSSQNLLGEKQSIEETTRNINKAIESLQNQKDNLLSSHNQTVASLNKELQSIRNELTTIRATISSTTDENTLSSLRSQETAILSRESRQKQKIASENSNFNSQNLSLDNQISAQNTYLANMEVKDEEFDENIETVNGSINVQWISVWQMIKAFSPVSPEILIVVMVITLWNILARMSIVPKFVLE